MYQQQQFSNLIHNQQQYQSLVSQLQQNNNIVVLPYANRVLESPYLKSATSEGLGSRKTGAPTSAWKALYTDIARSSPELQVLVTGHIAVSHEGRPEPYCNYMDNSDHITSPKANIYRQTVQEVKKIAPKLLFLAQLNHSGRQLTKIQKLRNHSLNVFSEHQSQIARAFRMFAKPNSSVISKSYPMTQFLNAAILLIDCGFDGVQIHCAHGYLLCDLVETNQFEQIVELLQKIREARPQAVLSVKVNVHENTLEFMRAVADYVDIIELSKGSYTEPKYMVDNFHNSYSYEFFTKEIYPQLRKDFAPVVCVTGGFHSLRQADEVLHEHKVAMVGMARLYCIKSVTSVQRLKIPSTIQMISKLLPLVSAGPATIYYQEALRLRATGRPVNVVKFGWWIWYLWTLILWFFGFQRYVAKK